MKINIRLRKLAALLLSGAMLAGGCINAYAGEYDDPDVELSAEFENEIADNYGDYPMEFTIGFGTHTQMPDGTSAKLVISADDGAEIEGADDQTGERVYGYSSIASERYVCQSSSNGGYYPNYGESVKIKAKDGQSVVKALVTISDKDNNVIHKEDTEVYVLVRDDVCVVSDESFDDCEKKLDRPIYKVLLFLKTPLGTVVKVFAFILLAGGMYAVLHRKDIKRRINGRRALKAEKRSDKGGNDNG